MHRFLVDPAGWRAERVVFSAAQAHQIRSVLRLRPGDQVRVFDGERACDRLVELVGPAEGQLLDELPQAAEPRTHVVAYPSLLPRDKFELVLQKLTEVGASRIVPVVCERSLVRDPPDERRLARWRLIVQEATEQCGRGRVPQLASAESFGAAIAHAPGQRLVAYAGGGLSLPSAVSEAPSTVSLFVGPEGDFSPREVQQAHQAAAHLVTLGPRVLRADTASPVFAALVLYELEGRSST